MRGSGLAHTIWILGVLEPIACTAALGALIFGRHVVRHRVLTAYLGIRIVAWIALTLVLKTSLLTAHDTYRDYFYIYWTSFAIEALLSLGIVYELYLLAMAPLPGLQRLGMLMFRWAGAIAVMVAAGMTFGSHISAQRFIVKAVLQFQQTESILTLCLLLFVTFAVRPMGLTYRSRIFGVSLGLGFLATTDLVQSSWLSHAASLTSIVNVFNGFAFLGTVLIWIAYFAIPEPKRQMIILPTTSPFLRWNQISLALGDAPGYVAIGGLDPSFLAPAEVEIMERASIKMALAAEA